jgi:hypothetical protein
MLLALIPCTSRVQDEILRPDFDQAHGARREFVFFDFGGRKWSKVVESG